MKWTRKHDCIFVRELSLFEPWKHRKGTPERVEVWERIAESLEQVEDPKFKTDKRSVRDRFNKLIKDHKKKDRDEERASGISPEQDEVDNALDNIVPIVEEAEKEQEQLNDAKLKKHEEEQGKAIEMRRRSLETFAETKTRNGEEPPKKRNRSTGSDTFKYLKEKAEMDNDFKKQEIEWRKEKEAKELKMQEQKLEIEKAELAQRAKETEEKSRREGMLLDQLTNMQTITMNFMQQQQQQSAAMMMMLDKMLNKD